MAKYGVEQGTDHVVRRSRREPGQVAAVVVAALFVATAVLDAGPGLLDNAVQLGFGAAGLAMSRRPRGARAFLIAGGVAYFLLWQFGTVIDPSLVPFHTGNVGVHLSLVASMIGLAVLSGGRAAEPVFVVPETAFRDVPARLVRRRQAPNRPPGRDDHTTAPRMATYRRLRLFASRV
ncbi:DUF4383 domain-containing protein [Actinophytocola glycyrrhizae]|uniref:DUF4383 domain-containing protein n=1 Tax=Actinophytocola glycyrrhizae TaxID=2044873 RepID=A0ABV9SA08_9PSEU